MKVDDYTRFALLAKYQIQVGLSARISVGAEKVGQRRVSRRVSMFLHRVQIVAKML
jgi:hypothetical protein